VLTLSQLQIVDAIVRAIAINVMHGLAITYRSSNVLGHHVAMLAHPLTTNLDPRITIDVLPRAAIR
jgi:hypothetical protein